MDQPESYRIRIKGHLSASWASWFEGLEVCHGENGETVLAGVLADQAALHGVLMRIRDLGLPLVSVNKVEQAGRQEPDVQAVEEGEK